MKFGFGHLTPSL